MADFVIDAASIKAFSARCRTVDRSLQLAFDRSLDPAGELVAEEARTLATAFPGKNRTDRIAKSIRKRRRGTRVRVIAGGDEAPEAAPINNAGKVGNFRHPLFGDYSSWWPQTAHPFLEPAGEAKQEEVGVIITEAVLAAFREL